MIKTPSDLEKSGRQFWKKVTSEYVLTEAHDLERLKMACRCLDEIAEAEQEVKINGMFVTNRYGNRVEHPAVKSMRDNRTLFCRIIRELGLDLETGPESRPPRQY